MAHPRVSANLPPYNPKKSTLAFGNGALPKLCRELRRSDVGVVRQALILLPDLLHNPENITSSCKEGIVQALLSLLNYHDSPVRYRAAHCLQLIAENAIGREFFIKLSAISLLAKLFDDTDAKVRNNAYLAIEMCSRTRQGVEGVLSAGLVPVLVDKLLLEDEINHKNIILDTLHWCLQIDPMSGLNCHSLKRLHPLLSHSSPDIRWRVAKCIYDLTVPYEGKKTACDCNMVNELSELLTDKDSNVRTHVTSALMSILVITEGKYGFLKTNGLTNLVTLLQDISPTVRLNAIKCITLLAEASEGKTILSSSLENIKLLQSTDSQPMVVTAAATAHHILTWKP